jgi:hypothetical protein
MCDKCSKNKQNCVMAGTKRRRKTTKRRKARVGAVAPRSSGNKGLIERALSFGVDAIGAEYGINTLVNTLTKDGTKMKGLNDPYAVGAIKMAVGIAGIMYSKNPMLRDAAAGAVAAGGLDMGRKVMSIPQIKGVSVGAVDWYNSDYESISGVEEDPDTNTYDLDEL